MKLPANHYCTVERQFYAGGPHLFPDRMTLRMCMGYPAFSVGLSFS